MYLRKAGEKNNSRDSSRLRSLAVEIPFLEKRKGKQWGQNQRSHHKDLVVLAKAIDAGAKFGYTSAIQNSLAPSNHCTFQLDWGTETAPHFTDETN